MPHELLTERLLLRQWRAADREPFARMNADATVMAHFPAALSTAESDEMAERIEAHIRERGWGLWAVEIPGVAPFIGFAGLAVPRFETHFTPCTEIGWRLAVGHWRRGYATEAARAVLAFAFGELQLPEIVSFAVEGNLRSRAVMERLAMTHSPSDDFDHPNIPFGHPLRRHVLYRKRHSAMER